MHRHIFQIARAAIAISFLSWPCSFAAVAQPDVEASGWSLQCRAGRVSLDDCGAVRGIVDVKDRARWLKAALQFDEAGELRLVLKTFPLPQRTEGMALLVDGRQLGTLGVDACDPTSCASTTKLPRSWSSGILGGGEAEIQIPLGGDSGVALPVSLRDVGDAVAKLRDRVASAMPDIRQQGFLEASSWTTSGHAGATFFVASDRPGAPALPTMLGMGASMPDCRASASAQRVVVFTGEGESLSARDLSRLDDLRADAKACAGRVYVIMHSPLRRPTIEVSGDSARPGLQTYIEDHGIASAPSR